MTWNWQKPDWLRFRWDPSRLQAAEEQFLVSGGVFIGTVRHFGKEDRDQLTIEAMSTEAVTTSEIEGEFLSGQYWRPWPKVVSSLPGRLPLNELVISLRTSHSSL